MKDILGIEISNKTVKFVEIKRNSLRNFAVVELPDNIVVNGQLIAPEAMSEVLRSTFKNEKFTVKNCALVLNDNDVYLRRMKVPAMSEKQLLLNMPYEFKDVLAEGKDKYIYDYSMVGLNKNEDDEVVDMELLGAVVRKDVIDKYIEMFKRASLKLVKALPREIALSNLVKELTQEDLNKDFAILDLGYKSSKIDIFASGVYEVTRTIDIGLEDVVKIAADILGVDIHMASKYLDQNQDNIQANEKCVDIYSQIATEVMRVMNYYTFENPNNTLETLYYCGGGSKIEPYIKEIKETISLELEPLSSLKQEASEAITMSAAALGACYD